MDQSKISYNTNVAALMNKIATITIIIIVVVVIVIVVVVVIIIIICR